MNVNSRRKHLAQANRSLGSPVSKCSMLLFMGCQWCPFWWESKANPSVWHRWRCHTGNTHSPTRLSYDKPWKELHKAAAGFTCSTNLTHKGRKAMACITSILAKLSVNGSVKCYICQSVDKMQFVEVIDSWFFVKTKRIVDTVQSGKTRFHE